ncbi:hypothetical protein LUZ60_007515 [Juncus effusus]|nr:hypothetical protein LUZ60_007515 [Juncus effusus]
MDLRWICFSLFLAIIGIIVSGEEEGMCSIFSSSCEMDSKEPLYWKVTNPTLNLSHLQDLPGFTRSIYKRDHALITPESQVFSPLPDWINTLGAFLITPAVGSYFTMYLTKMQEGSQSALPPKDIERCKYEYNFQFIFVVHGSVELETETVHKLDVDSYAYFPPNMHHLMKSNEPSTLIIFERRYDKIKAKLPEIIISSTDKQPLPETPGEIFELRKLLPTSTSYDFNIHIMDFKPGEFLNVKEVL